MKVIDSFKDEYYFLSNYYMADVKLDGLTYANNEAAFQSAKCQSVEDRIKFCCLPPNEAKHIGRHLKLRDDWEEVKEDIMYQICFNKFTFNPELGKKLIATGDSVLIEGNTWNDKEWGMVNGVGRNKLGKILMRVRKELNK